MLPFYHHVANTSLFACLFQISSQISSRQSKLREEHHPNFNSTNEQKWLQYYAMVLGILCT
jgi:hypothetical protein